METSESNNNNNNSESSKNEKDKNENLSNVLWMMAEKCLQANQIIQAIQCLEAIIQSEEIRFSPTIVIKTRVRLAEILLTYTENYEEALHHLNKAVT